MTKQLEFRHPMTIKPKVSANIILWIILAFVVIALIWAGLTEIDRTCLLYTSPSPRDRQKSRMPSSA